MANRPRRLRVQIGEIHYSAAEAHPTVRDAFDCALRWDKLVGGLRVDGGPCPGDLARLVVQVCRHGMHRHAKAANPGYDCLDRRGRRVQIKAIGTDSRHAIELDPTKADRLIVVRIYPTEWSVLYDGPIEGLPHYPTPTNRRKIRIRLSNLRLVSKPRTWSRFWHLGGTESYLTWQTRNAA